jgi:hypothetical protein
MKQGRKKVRKKKRMKRERKKDRQITLLSISSRDVGK